jgi:hypothetical protein
VSRRGREYRQRVAVHRKDTAPTNIGVVRMRTSWRSVQQKRLAKVMIEQHPTRAQASAILVRDGDVEVNRDQFVSCREAISAREVESGAEAG